MMVQILEVIIYIKDKKKVPLKEFKIMHSFEYTGARIFGSIVTNKNNEYIMTS